MNFAALHAAGRSLGREPGAGSARAAASGLAGPSSLRPSVVIGLVSLISFALSWPHALFVWKTGTFFDTDDAMRMVQVRAWMAGQAWFDLAAHRLDPPGGVLMHWSRVVDVPLAVLIRLFSLAAAPDVAERLARIVFPFAMQVAMISAAVFAAGILAGPGTAFPAALLVVASGFQFGQFPAGRVDHHAPQIVLLMTLTGLCADVLVTARARSAILAALCMATSVAISLENLPFIGLAGAALTLAWARGGPVQDRALRAFGCGLIAFAGLAFVATVDPRRYAAVTADAYSLPHLLTAVCGGATLILLSFTSDRLHSRMARTIALASAGLLTLLVVAVCCPGAFRSPYADIDPVVRDVWLSRVTEAMPLHMTVRLHPQALTLLVCPILVGLAGMIWATISSRGSSRGAWLLTASMTLVGLALSLWEVRVIASTTPLALLGGVWAATVIQDRLTARGVRAAVVSGYLALIPFAPLAWAVVPTPEGDPRVAQSAEAAAACRQADTLASLASLPAGLVLAPVDAGSHLLATTALSVIGAPYHRNNAGNRTVIDGFSGSARDAEAVVRKTGARYVAICPGQVQATALAERNPEGLAAHLLADRPPSWLEPIALPGTRYKVFAVRASP